MEKSSALLLQLLSIPTALVATYSCIKPKDGGSSIKQPNACVRVANAIVPLGTLCKEEDIERINKPDSYRCSFESCALPDTGKCEDGYSPGVVSTPPTRVICQIFNPTDL